MPVVRALDDRDLDAVATLHRSVGWTPPTLEVWAHLWRDNPARLAAPDTARGWVLVEQDRVVGYLANIVQQYTLDGRLLTAAERREPGRRSGVSRQQSAALSGVRAPGERATAPQHDRGAAGVADLGVPEVQADPAARLQPEPVLDSAADGVRAGGAAKEGIFSGD